MEQSCYNCVHGLVCTHRFKVEESVIGFPYKKLMDVNEFYTELRKQMAKYCQYYTQKD